LLKDAWTIAIKTLSWMEKQKLSERLALAKTLKELHVKDPNPIRYGYGLVIETTRRKNLLDKLINTVTAPKKISEYNIGIQSFLRLYIYQTRAAKNWVRINLQEAKQIAGMGRSILGWQTVREIEPILGFLLTQPIDAILNSAHDEQLVGLRTFHPSWFVKYAYKLMGRGDAIAFLVGSVSPPPTYIRLNTLVATEEAIVEKMSIEGVRMEKALPLQNAYKILEAKKPLNTLQSYREGLFYIQDKASCFATEAASPKQGNVVFDVCAAPGAKTTYIAQLMQNSGVIYSIDFSTRRLDAWKKENTRMGNKIAQPILADAMAPLPLVGEADLVVLDPPCSSTGVFAKQPSAKWRLRPKSIEKMTTIQWRMINNCADKVATGGVLTYSTCSVSVEENEMIVERFLKWHSEFSLAPIEPQIGLQGMRGLTLCRRLYPHIHQCNGFFIAKLRKN
jgi:16S rRNA (cytosine967-C5)-methyltransferase